jgi:hypothetical protein
MRECGIAGAFRGQLAQAAHDVRARHPHAGLLARGSASRAPGLALEKRNVAGARPPRARDSIDLYGAPGVDHGLAIILPRMAELKRRYFVAGEFRSNLEGHCEGTVLLPDEIVAE